MKKEVEFLGKKVQDAVDEGLKTLGITLDDADIKIISNGGLFKKAKIVIAYDDGLSEEEAEKAAKKAAEEKAAAARLAAKEAAKPEQKKAPENEPHWGSAPIKREPSTVSDFGKGEKVAEPSEPAADNESVKPRAEKQNKPRKEKPQGERKEKPAVKKEHPERVSAAPTDEQLEFAKNFVSELIAKMNIEGSVEVVSEDGLRVNVVTEDSRIIGHRGEVLDSVQQLLSALINTSHNEFVHITVDGLGYRGRRKESLENLARRMADKAVRTHRKVTLEVMNSADRRIVHAALGEREDVFTRSEGHEPSRRVVIVPKRR